MRIRIGQVETGIAGLRREFAYADEDTAILSAHLVAAYENAVGGDGKRCDQRAEVSDRAADCRSALQLPRGQLQDSMFTIDL